MLVSRVDYVIESSHLFFSRFWDNNLCSPFLDTCKMVVLLLSFLWSNHICPSRSLVCRSSWSKKLSFCSSSFHLFSLRILLSRNCLFLGIIFIWYFHYEQNVFSKIANKCIWINFLIFTSRLPKRLKLKEN